MSNVKTLLNEELKKYDCYINHKLEQLQELAIHQQKLEDQLNRLKETKKDLIKALEALNE